MSRFTRRALFSLGALFGLAAVAKGQQTDADDQLPESLQRKPNTLRECIEQIEAMKQLLVKARPTAVAQQQVADDDVPRIGTGTELALKLNLDKAALRQVGDNEYIIVVSGPLRQPPQP